MSKIEFGGNVFEGFELEDVIEFLTSGINFSHFETISNDITDCDDHGRACHDVIFKDTSTNKFYHTFYYQDDEYGVDDFDFEDIVKFIVEVFPKTVVETKYLSAKEINSGKYEFVD